MPWVKGQSGNPAGRRTTAQKTDKALRNRLRKTLAEDNAFYFEQLREFAKADIKAIELVLRYTLHPMAPQQPTYRFTMPNGCSSLTDKITAILGAIAEGKLPPVDGARLLDSLARLAQLDIMRNIEHQVEKLANDSSRRETLDGASLLLEKLHETVKGNGSG